MQGRNFAIIGPPGSGKTTLLKHVALVLAAQRPIRNGTTINRLPILLFLRDHAPAIEKNPHLTLEEAIQDKLKMWQLQRPSGWFQQKLQTGECVVLLDGLDEVANPTVRKQVVQWVEQLMVKHANNRFIITSRPHGYRSNPLTEVTVLEVRPFTLEQVQQFVQNWYLANEIMAAQRDDPGVRMAAQSGANDLMARLRQIATLLDMAVNPLLLTMIATVHRYRRSLPGRRIELYAEICEVFLGKRQQSKGIEESLTPAQKQRVLQPLAYHMMRQNEREILWAELVAVLAEPLAQVSNELSPEEFLQVIMGGSGLVVEREMGLFSFAHLTFQEYLAAVHVHDQKREQSLLKHVDDSWWHETIRLYAAHADATNIIKACLGMKTPSVQALTLAMECLEEAREVQPKLRSVFERLADSVEHEKPEVRRIAAEVRLALRLRRMLRVDEHKYVDDSFITQAEYQLFVNEEGDNGRFRQPDHWQTLDFTPGDGQSPIAGIRPQDALDFCQWLNQRETNDWHYRLAQPEETEIEIIKRELPGETADESPVQISYWTATKDGYRASNQELPRSMQAGLSQRLQHRLADDWDLHHRTDYDDIVVNEARKFIIGRARQRQFTLLDLDRPFTRDEELKAARERLLDRTTPATITQLDTALNKTITQLQRLRLAKAKEVELDDVMAYGADFIQIMKHVQGLATEKDLETVQALSQQLHFSLDHAHDLAHNRQSVVQQELLRALTTSLKHVHDIVQILERAQTRARTRVRANPLLRIMDLLTQLPKEQDQRRLRQIRYALDDYVDFYIDFALLEERRAGHIPALEGIRIVREQH
jgi:energy-coupling factor transporter ATP-binding protein EcfA2